MASIAQWIEHWSRKPGVVSSILTGGSAFAFDTFANSLNIAGRSQLSVIAASIAQWLEHWSCKPGVVSSILTGGLHFSLQIKLQLQTTSNTYLTQCNFAMIPSTFQQKKHTVSHLFY